MCTPIVEFAPAESRVRSNWTELNKERARRLIAAGKITEAGRRTLPDLSDEAVRVPNDVQARLMATPGAWEALQAFPTLYQRVRLGYFEELRNRDPTTWEKRLAHFIAQTAKNKMFGDWNDADLPRTDG